MTHQSNNLKVFVVILLISSLLSYYLGRATTSRIEALESSAPVAPSTCEPSVDSCAGYEELKKQLSGLSPAEIQEYLKTADAETKLKKADKILGKIMSALVATVGYRLQKSDLDQLGQLSKSSIDTQPKPAQIPEPVQDPAPVPAKVANATPLPSENRQLQRDIRNARTEEEAKAIVDSLGTEFAKKIQSSSALDRNLIRDLSGNYEGAIQKGEKTFRTTMQFQGRASADAVTGRAVVEIFNPEGKSISRGSSSGNLTKSYSANGPVVFIECGGDYFELIYFPSLGQWIGNFLEMDKGALKKTGDVTLRRS